jgi:hypothetical protein
LPDGSTSTGRRRKTVSRHDTMLRGWSGTRPTRASAMVPDQSQKPANVEYRSLQPGLKSSTNLSFQSLGLAKREPGIHNRQPVQMRRTGFRVIQYRRRSWIGFSLREPQDDVEGVRRAVARPPWYPINLRSQPTSRPAHPWRRGGRGLLRHRPGGAGSRRREGRPAAPGPAGAGAGLRPVLAGRRFGRARGDDRRERRCEGKEGERGGARPAHPWRRGGRGLLRHRPGGAGSRRREGRPGVRASVRQRDIDAEYSARRVSAHLTHSPPSSRGREAADAKADQRRRDWARARAREKMGVSE